MTELEEASTARLAMKKRDARRRVQDEADIALGGIDRGGCLQMKLMHLDNGSVRFEKAIEVSKARSNRK